jgi:hypothetical protein
MGILAMTVNPKLGERIMIIGQNIPLVQRASFHFSKQGAEVLPYYGFPSVEEVELFNPDLIVLCSFVPQEFLKSLKRPYLIWSE